MDYNRNHSNKNKWHSNKNNQQNSGKQNQNEKDDIVKVSLNTPTCEYCQQPITELACALASKESGEPVHFDCVLDRLINTEKLAENERISYIGQGRFAVVYFENPHDLRHFEIRRIIEWENKEQTHQWRSDIANLYSSVK